MHRFLALAFMLTVIAQTALACVLPPPMMGAVFVQDGVKGGEWRFQQIGALALPEQPLFLTLASDGAMQVSGLCGAMGGTYQGDHNLMKLALTLQSPAPCDPALAAFDNDLLALLGDVTLYALSADGETLSLTTADSAEITLERLTLD